MTVFSAIIMNLVLFLGIAFLFVHRKRVFCDLMNWVGRSQNSTILFFGTASVIILYNIIHLSVADFGQYKLGIFVAFLIGILCSFWKCRDFLAIRGIAVLLLLFAKYSLDSVFMEDLKFHNYFVGLQYCIIIFAMYLGVYPYIWRNFTEKFLDNKKIRDFARTVSLFLLVFMIIFYVRNILM